MESDAGSSPVASPEPTSRASGGPRLLLLVDDFPTMQVWSDAVAELALALRGLGLGLVLRRSIDLEDGGALTIPAAIRLVVIASDGASPAWRTERTLRMLREAGRRRATAIVHLLSRPRWYRTGVSPDPVSLRAEHVDQANAQWDRRQEPSLLSVPLDDVVPVPVVEASAVEALAQLVGGTASAWMPTAALLLREDLTAEAAQPGKSMHPKASVDDFKAEVSPLTFRLATYLAAVPPDLAVMQDLRSRLLPESSVENLAEVLSGPLMVAEGPGDSGFRFAEDVRQEFLASARRSDIERVVRAVSRWVDKAPSVASFTSIFDAPSSPAPRASARAGSSRQRDDEMWRRARALVLVALGGPFYAQGRRELGELPSQGGPSVSVDPSSSPPNSADGESMTSPIETTPLPQTSSGAPGLHVERRASVGEFPLRNPNFTGRQELLTDLHASLRASEPAGAPPSSGMTAVIPHALHGMGGVGKSLLAIEYLYRHSHEYDVIWWLSAERTTDIQSGLITLGQRLGLNVTQEANASVPVVLDALRRGEPYGNWLLVLDNAESPEQVTPFLPKNGPGHILITSRDARWSQVARPLEVNVFTRDESKQLLQRRGTGISDQDADRLADALGDLPLAIEQAAAWHAETGMPAEEYLRLLEEKQVELLQQPAPIDYQIPVIAAWNVSLDQLQGRSPEALQLLQVCSFFAAAPIPRTMLAAARGQQLTPMLDAVLQNPIRFANALREINRYSLARIDHRTNAIQMHRLVQAALIARMSEDEQHEMRHAAHRILATNDPGDPENPLQYPVYGALYPHTRASDAVHSPEPWIRDLVINEARYLYRWGDHEEAIALSQDAYDAWREAHGDDDPQTRGIARWLGFFLWTVGRYADAAAVNEATLQVYRRMEESGRPDPDGEIQVLLNVATDRRADGNFADALKIAEDVFSRSMRAYGENSPETLLAAHDLAVSLRLSGFFERARERDEDTYNRKLGIFGPDHVVTMVTRLSLIVDIRELGDYAQAERLQAYELTRAETTLGHLDPVTLLARRLLAVAERKIGEHDRALSNSELVSSQYRDRYGDQHPATLAAESSYAIDLRQVGDLLRAQEMGEAIVDRYVAVLGAKHPHTLTAQLNLAIAYRLRGDVARALQLDTAAHEALAQQLGADHPSTLVAAINLASDHFVTGHRELALERDQASWRRLAAIFGAEHPTTLVCESNLATDLRALGRHDEAQEHHTYAIGRLRGLLGEGHRGVTEAESWDERANCDLDLMAL